MNATPMTDRVPVTTLADLDALDQDEVVVDQPPTIKLEARIAALEATVARLTAEPDQDEIEAAWDALDPDALDELDLKSALTAFLERRMRG